MNFNKGFNAHNFLTKVLFFRSFLWYYILFLVIVLALFFAYGWFRNYREEKAK
jgi:hypothetical protein